MHEGKEFRTYDVNSTDFIQERVRRTYYTMHTKQTVEFVEKRVRTLSPPIFLTFRPSLLTWKIQGKLTFFNLALSSFELSTADHFSLLQNSTNFFLSFFFCEFRRSSSFPAHISFYFFTFHLLVNTLFIKNFLLVQEIFNFSRFFTLQIFNFWRNVYINPMLLKLGFQTIYLSLTKQLKIKIDFWARNLLEFKKLLEPRRQ